jgi:hypothetical protein
MQRIAPIVDQFEEARRLIHGGSLSHLRMALLLLDNASEVMMYRQVVRVLEHREYQGRTLERAREVMSKQELADFQREFGIQTVSAKERRALLRDYSAKVDFLVAADGKLPKPLGQVLKAIHRYRNEAYHRDKIRRDTLRSAVLVLYDIATDLLTRLPPWTVGIAGGEDWTAFCRRYGLKSAFDVMHGGLERIVAHLREDVRLDVHDLARGLADHLADRLDGIERSVTFVAENSVGGFTIEQELKRIQFWAEHGEVPPDAQDRRLQGYTPRYSMRDVARWRAASQALVEYSDKLELFGAFARTEVEVEDLEEKVDEVVIILDQAIQWASDLRRGK